LVLFCGACGPFCCLNLFKFALIILFIFDKVFFPHPPPLCSSVYLVKD
jgi:hypothetical protein